ncbi:hypothetical protein ACTOB_001991 [Actinoplanes oblitus]|uniref:Uncharacterized protein n=1 Tax=Actinoplanes oblitus TaxID=3040509 RepID=A0ABY8WLM8_9ACTN|nr:hypothetical protein [Actinoplanes oblitus]WIM98392.1 hypothetical protein ACTOB_001991 [Actinoplanes oblitus]
MRSFALFRAARRTIVFDMPEIMIDVAGTPGNAMAGLAGLGPIIPLGPPSVPGAGARAAAGTTVRFRVAGEGGVRSV